MDYVDFSKKLYIPKSPPQKIEKIEFLVPSSTDVAKGSEIQVYESRLYRLPERTPHTGGVLDPRLGISSKGAVCETCAQNLQDCAGHFGYIQLQLPLFHIGYLNYTIKILQSICKTCSRVLLSQTDREFFQKKLRNPKLEESARKAIFKKIHTKCKSTGNQTRLCPFCGNENAVVKKIGGAYKIMHDKFRNKTEELKVTEFAQALLYNDTIEKFLPKMTDDLNPLRVLHLFENVPEEDVDFLCLGCRPENLIVTCLPVPPVCIRPSVEMEGAGSNEDDITIKLTQILDYNSRLKNGFDQGIGITSVMEIWDAMQNEFATVINSDLPGLSSLLQPQRKVRGYVQRLKGKAGRFRGNLSGKRVDFSGRTVISPDPNLEIDELAVPLHVATTLTYPERVSVHNLTHLQRKILNGQFNHPGANWVIKEDGVKYTLRFADRRKIARELKPGDIVERHLRDGDVVLFNRQPSLHRVSMMAHKAKVRPQRTFSFNECVCSPYNADFDGDEMNLHLPQTEEAKAEALMLMSTQHNLCSPKSGELLISATQDFLTCAYLITSKDVYFTRSQMGLYSCSMCNALQNIDFPFPAVMKPMELWTGKQLIEILLRPNAQCRVLVNLEMKEKFYSRKDEHLCSEDGYVHFLNSELISGQLGKNVLGGHPGTLCFSFASQFSLGGLFGVLKNDYSGKTAAVVMGRLAKLSARYMGERGFSIGLEDVTPSTWLQEETTKRIQTSYIECEELIRSFKQGTLASNPGMTEEETLEARVTSVLNNIRSEAGKLCMDSLDFHNSALIMSRCGAKGSPINIAQMIACVGQQMVNGTRAPNGFTNRCLPHFSKGDKTPQAKGFVANSFYSGLSPTEFFFHAMAGREGLVDTAVKTAETGYMSRRLIKALEDLFVHYDLTVRDSASAVVQMRYGDDGLDPPKMENSEGRPIDLDRLMNQVQSRTRRAGPGLREAQVPLPKVLENLIEPIKQTPESLVDKRTSRPIGHLLSPLVKDELGRFADSRLEGYRRTRRRLGLAEDQRGDPRLEYLAAMDGFTPDELERFLQALIRKYEDKMIDPGCTVGAIAAQSIGEPGTQMTLKTFHFAGIGSMQVTQGVPRIKEIMNASKNISTPVITAALECDDSRVFAHLVKGRIERTTIEDVARKITATRTLDDYIVVVDLNLQVISLLELDVNCHSIKESILTDEVLKMRKSGVLVESSSRLTINLFESDVIINSEELILDLERLEKAVPKVTIHGLPNVKRVMVQRSAHYQSPDKEKFTLAAEGNCLVEIMGIPGVDGYRTTTNHVMECEKALGIEAARSKIISEIEDSMNAYGMVVDHRHTMLLADCMTYKGEVLGINRTGISQMKESVLHAASFEKTADHLFDAAIHGRVDNISGVSESIIMGNPMPTGTGMFNLIYQDKLDNEPLSVRPDPVFKI